MGPRLFSPAVATLATQRNPGNKGRRFPAEILSEAEVRALMRAASNRAPSGLRAKAHIVVMYRAGLRIAETLALRPKDLDLEAGHLTVLRGKGDRRRTVGIDPGAQAIIERWLAVRARLAAERGWSAARRPVFCSLGGNKLDAGNVRKQLHRLARRAEIDKRVHPHGLRHTHAFELAQEGVPVTMIQAQLGHSSLATTQIYLNHIAPAQLIAAIRAREWSPLDNGDPTPTPQGGTTR